MSGIKNVSLGKDVSVQSPMNLYGCTIGNNVKIGPFVEVQSNSFIGDDAIISSHSFICSGVSIGRKTFVGHGVMFVNDKFDSDILENWKMQHTVVGERVRIGSNATILPVNIGDGAIIGAGAVVTKDVPAGETWVGNPAKKLEK
jgi:acetyltransferase-like isoleucine patch superfamily enzyme